MQQTLSVDVVIIGAGIAGLWLHHRLKQLGFQSLLLEKNAIGQGQTLSSQGIIHGGAKYALNGILSKATQAIGDMPARWQACLQGEGDIDLTAATMLAPHQLMWSTDKLSSKMVSFFASKALASRMQAITPDNSTALFHHPDFNGTLYQLDEPVLDIPSVLHCLAEPYQDSILQIPTEHEMSWKTIDKGVQAIQFGDELTLTAQHFVLTAGEGNETLLAELGISQPQMQRRPLQMVLCRSKKPNQPLPALYAHSLGAGSKPIATITSHYDKTGNVVWYIGGNIAEQGVGKSASQLQQEAEKLLADIMPWVDLPSLEWAVHAVDRAEPKQSALTRPDTAFVESVDNVHIAWPTKLALAPDLADKTLHALQQASLQQHDLDNTPLPTCLQPAPFAPALWDRVF